MNSSKRTETGSMAVGVALAVVVALIVGMFAHSLFTEAALMIESITPR